MAALDLARCIPDFVHHILPVPAKVGELSDRTLTTLIEMLLILLCIQNCSVVDPVYH